MSGSATWSMGYKQINLEQLRTLPILRVPGLHPEYTGMGCAFSPPGHPRYVVSSWSLGSHSYDIYCFIVDPEGNARDLGKTYPKDGELDFLWIAPPEDHDLVESWIVGVYMHWMDAWGDGTRKVLNADQWSYHVRTPEDDLDNYGAVIYIRQWYPQHQPRIEFIAGYKGPYVRKEDQTHAEE